MTDPFISNERSIFATTPSPSSLPCAFYLITRCVFYLMCFIWRTVREVETAPVHLRSRIYTHATCTSKYARVYDCIYVATCVTFIAARTVRAIMLGRRKHHGGTISLSLSLFPRVLARARRIQEIGLSRLKYILTHARPRKITVGRAYRPFTFPRYTSKFA